MEIEVNKKQIANATRELRLQELSEKELRQKIRNNKYALPLSIISIVIALGGFVWSIYKPSDNVLPVEVDQRIKQIENKQESLTNGFKKENDSLRSELHKAEMIRAVYESER